MGGGRFPSPLRGPRPGSRSSGAQAARAPGVGRPEEGSGSAPGSRKGPRGEPGPPATGPRPAEGRSPVALSGPAFPPGSGSDRRCARRGGLGSEPQQSRCLFPGAGAPSTWHLLRAAPAGTKEGAVHPPGFERLRGSPVSKGSSSAAERRGKAFVRKKGFLCFHGSFQKPLFLLPVASPSALQVPPNLLLPRVQSSELARLEEQAGVSQANPAPGPQLRGPFTALAESPYS